MSHRTYSYHCPSCGLQGACSKHYLPLGKCPQCFSDLALGLPLSRAQKEIQELAAQALSRANDSRNMAKGEWPRSRWWLFWLLLVEVWELGWALVRLWWVRTSYTEDHGYTPLAVRDARRHVEHEVGDCAVFLAFILSRL